MQDPLFFATDNTIVILSISDIAVDVAHRGKKEEKKKVRVILKFILENHEPNGGFQFSTNANLSERGKN